MNFRFPRWRNWIFAFALWLPTLTSAVETSCYYQHLGRMMGGDHGYADIFDPDAYLHSDRLLFLSDGLNRADHFSLGPQVARAFPQKRVISVDFGYPGSIENGNLKLMSLDNTKAFPFADNSFDTIVLRRGLCVCHQNQCCGGFLPDSAEAKNFFREVVRVLDKRVSHSKAVLHGAYAVTPEIERVWIRYLSEIEKEFGVKATLYKEKATDQFLMIGIRP